MGSGTAGLVGLINKDGLNGARITTEDGDWPAEGVRNEERYIQFTVPATSGSTVWTSRETSRRAARLVA